MTRLRNHALVAAVTAMSLIGCNTYTPPRELTREKPKQPDGKKKARRSMQRASRKRNRKA